jgi:hypothetical protein
MKSLLSFALIFVFSLSAYSFDNISESETTTTTCLKGKYKRAKKRANKRHGVYHSKCMRTKRIRVRN